MLPNKSRKCMNKLEVGEVLLIIILTRTKLVSPVVEISGVAGAGIP